MHCAKALERDLLGLFLCNKQPIVIETKEKLIEKNEQNQPTEC